MCVIIRLLPTSETFQILVCVLLSRVASQHFERDVAVQTLDSCLNLPADELEHHLLKGLNSVNAAIALTACKQSRLILQ